MDDFTRAYVHAAAWTEDPHPGQGEYPEPDHGELSPAFIAQAIVDCGRFQYLAGLYAAENPEQAGHDFWLTRNGHGAGFWDGEWPEPAASILTDISETFGEYYAGVFADGRDTAGE